MRRVVMALGAGVVGGLSLAAIPQPRIEAEHVWTSPSEGVRIDWTSLSVEVQRTASDPHALTDSKPSEQRAIDEVDAALPDVLNGLHVTPDRTVSDARGRELQSDQTGWEIARTSYAARGPVTVTGRASVLPLVSGWLREQAHPAPPRSPVLLGGAQETTGVVLDARGTGVLPVVVPRVIGPSGEVVHDAFLWQDLAYSRAPVVWVPSAATREAQAAGVKPLFLRAIGGGLGTIEVDAATADKIRALAETSVLGDGAFVIVVDRE
jgi:hypothetical protein